jgi:hypothetical protein
MDEAANDTATAAEEAINSQKGGKKGKKAKKSGGKSKYLYFFFFFGLFPILIHPLLLVGRPGLTVNVRMTLRMLKAVLTLKGTAKNGQIILMMLALNSHGFLFLLT